MSNDEPKFEWDENKNVRNILKHKISFDDAVEVFRDPLAIFIRDSLHSIDEERFIAIGHTLQGLLVVVVHSHDDDESLVRLISARAATKKEREYYEEGI